MDGLQSRMKWAEERISKLEDRITEMTQYEQQRENRLKRNGQSLWRSNICVIGDPEEEKKRSRAEKVLEEITAEKFPYLDKHISPQFKISRFKQDKPKEISITMHHSKTSENSRKKKILKAFREKHHLLPIREKHFK